MFTIYNNSVSTNVILLCEIDTNLALNQGGISKGNSNLPTVPERGKLGGPSNDRNNAPSNRSDYSRSNGSVDSEKSSPDKDPKLSVSEAFGIDERNLHQKDEDKSLARAVADLD